MNRIEATRDEYTNNYDNSNTNERFQHINIRVERRCNWNRRLQNEEFTMIIPVTLTYYELKQFLEKKYKPRKFSREVKLNGWSSVGDLNMPIRNHGEGVLWYYIKY